ncbi:MAG: aconitate hydratase AcnA [Spirochaetota bacterium]
MKRAALPDQDCEYVSLEANLPGGAQALSEMTYAQRILAENLLRHGGGGRELSALASRRHDLDFPWYPERVLLQDLTGTPALVDFAGLRDAVAEGGGDPRSVNPRVPTFFVVDHSLNVIADGSHEGAVGTNRATEERQNAERFAFLSWCGAAFDKLTLLPRGGGILHQLNLEGLSPVIAVVDGLAFPDSLVGTDSHTPMINALGVLGWGLGGIEAESVMLGRPVLAALPEILRVRLSGKAREGTTATDIALHLTEYLRKAGVVGSILEFHGEGARCLSLQDRATIANMAPEYGTTAALFPLDERSIEFLSLTGRSSAQIALVEAYARAQGLWWDAFDQARFDRVLDFDLGIVGPCLAGPANPHDRIALVDFGGRKAAPDAAVAASAGDLLPGDGALVIAAIASCTNTANPRSVVAAALLARNARRRGLVRKPWVKTSFAPGSLAVRAYLAEAGLLGPLAELGFGIVGFGCTTCNGMSGPLDPGIAAEIGRRGLRASALVSGNRNFNGRIHPLVAEAFIASPALVVAFALAGTTRVDLARASLGTDEAGRAVLLAELWPKDEEIEALVRDFVKPRHFAPPAVVPIAGSGETPSSVSARFAWDENSTYIRRPPYWEASLSAPSPLRGLRVLALLGDNVTTDDLSPSGAILAESAAGRWLSSRGVAKEEYNSYGTRRGDHLVAVRATLANNRLRNEMAGGREGSLTRLEPEGTILSIHEAGETYLARGQELVIMAGKNYGAGSSRDWAAKGVRLLGVRAVVAESFERIHRSNLIGMGVLPLEFTGGASRMSLGFDGSETLSFLAERGLPAPRAILTFDVKRGDGSVTGARFLCRLDSEEEARTFAAGGLLPMVRDELLGRAKNPKE